MKMMNEKVIERMNEIVEWSEEYNIPVCKAVYDLLFNYYETAGFWTDVLETELNAMSEPELIEIYCKI